MANLQFQSLYQLLELLRQRELTDLQRCKDLYETYYESTICLFGDRALTPYKDRHAAEDFRKGRDFSPI